MTVPDAIDATAGACRYLYHLHRHDQQPHRRPTRCHRHGYWQVELIAAGKVEVTTAAGRRLLPPGHGLVLPPQCAHDFRYLSASVFTSIKFACERPHRAAGEHSFVTDAQPVAGIIAALDDRCRTQPTLSGTDQAVVAHLLAALVAAVLPPVDGPVIADPLVRAALDEIERSGGRRMSVTCLANRLGYSPSRLAARFRAVTGATVKVHLDQACARAAARLLTYSDERVADIAEDLGFGDGFTFSRFFRRVSGESPTAFRCKARAGGMP